MLSIVLYGSIGLLLGIGVSAALGKFDFLKNLFSESGTASFGRTGAALALVAAIAWVSWIVYRKEALPDLGGIALFIGTLYGLSKAGSVAQSFSGKDNGDVQK